jgi:hypothetical protein
MRGQVDVRQAIRHVPSRRWEETRLHSGSGCDLAWVMPTGAQGFTFVIAAEENLPCQFVAVCNARTDPVDRRSLGVFPRLCVPQLAGQALLLSTSAARQDGMLI